ncbi:MAG: DUF5009 domain-containing protein [Sedimentisphaerales bacterium]|nr:DUF5009 domain-containing protein [Sedimentisphaerales bacterium]
MEAEQAQQAPAGKAVAGERLRSLDALRGFDMFWIIGGGAIVWSLAQAWDHDILQRVIMPQMRHPDWEGFTAWDLIMPLFLFVVGTAMPFSFARRLARQSKGRLYLHILIRSLLLFGLGMIAQGHLLEFDADRLHIYCNTLQAIAAGYLIASILLLQLRLRWQIAAVVLLLVLFWLLMSRVPVPGHGAVLLKPEANLAIYLDHSLLGRFEDGTSYTWILSSLTFPCTVMLGVWAGMLLRSSLAAAKKFLALLALGGGTLGLGWLWGTHAGPLTFPIIKHIWSSSMVLFAGGLSLLLLAVFYLVIDVLRLWRWSYGFLVIGRNAIFVYMAVSLWSFRDLAGVFVDGLDRWTGAWHDFTRALAGFVLLWLILFWMYRKKTFIKI